MSEQTYADQVVGITEAIQAKAKTIKEFEKSRADWVRPEGCSIYLGRHTYIVRKDGVYPPLAAVHREILSFFDMRLHGLHSELEGLRFQLIQLGRKS